MLRLMDGKRAILFSSDPPYLVDYDGTNHPHKWNASEEEKKRKNRDWSDTYAVTWDVPMRQHVAPGEICYEPFSGSGSQIMAA